MHWGQPLFRSSLILLTTIGHLALPGMMTAHAQVDDAQRQKLHEQRLERLWKGQWRSFAEPYFEYDSGFFDIHNYEPGKPSSLPLTEKDLKKFTLHLEWVPREDAYRVSKDLPPPDEDIRAALSVLPRLEPGHYGHICTVSVDEVRRDRQQVEVRQVRFINTNKLMLEKDQALDAIRAELRGRPQLNVEAWEIVDFNFRFRQQIETMRSGRLIMTDFDIPAYIHSAGQLWEGPFHVVIIDRGLGLEALPMEKIKVGLDEQQFIRMLESRGKSKTAFAELVAQALDRRLTTKQREAALARWIDDYDPAAVLASQQQPTEPQPPAIITAAESSVATSDATIDTPDAPPTDDAIPPETAVSTATPAETEPRPAQASIDTYLDGEDSPSRPAGASIFDFGRE